MGYGVRFMELHDQVTSPELSNKLHKLGVTAPSAFWRDYTGSNPHELEWAQDFKPYYCEDNVNCYSVAELDEILPATIEVRGNVGQLRIEPIDRNGRRHYQVGYWLGFSSNPRAPRIPRTRARSCSSTSSRTGSLVEILNKHSVVYSAKLSAEPLERFHAVQVLPSEMRGELASFAAAASHDALAHAAANYGCTCFASCSVPSTGCACWRSLYRASQQDSVSYRSGDYQHRKAVSEQPSPRSFVASLPGSMTLHPAFYGR